MNEEKNPEQPVAPETSTLEAERPNNKPEPDTSVHIKHAHKLVYWYIVLLIIAGLAGLGTYLYHRHHTKPVAIQKSQSHPTSTPSSKGAPAVGQPASPTYPDSYSYLTYRSNGSPSTFYIYTFSGKVVAQVAVPSADKFSYIYARNNQGLVLENAQQDIALTKNTNSNYVLVGFNGSAKTLPTAIFPILSASRRNAVLSGTNQIVYSDCNSTSETCTLSGVNLTSGTVTTYLTSKGISTCCSVVSPYDVLGASNGIVYYSYDTGKSNSQLIVYNTNTRKVVRTYNLETVLGSAPNLSADFKYAVYPTEQNNYTDYVLNLTNGGVTTFSTVTLGGLDVGYQNFLWSPNDEYVEFSSPAPGARTASTPPMTINTYNIQTGKINTLKNLGASRYNEADVITWLSNSELYYGAVSTTAANDFGPPYYKITYLVLNMQSGMISNKPISSGYTLVPPE